MSSVAAGWYADAENPALIRWWDGEAWTSNTQPNPATAAAPVPPPFADPILSTPTLSAAPLSASQTEQQPEQQSEQQPEPQSAPQSAPQSSPSFPISEPVRLVPPTPPVSEPAVSGWAINAPLLATAPAPTPAWGATQTSQPTPWTTTPAFAQPTASVDLASVDYEPLQRTWGGSRQSSQRTATGVSTGGAWMLALSPLLQLGLIALGWVLTDGGTSSSTALIGSALGAVLVAWVIIATIADFRRLGALGHEYRPSIAWILVGPLLYLIARAIHVQRTTGRGVAPTWVFVVLSIVVGAALAGISTALPRDASTSELRAVESTIVADLQQQGFNYSVLCPDRAELAAGSTFVCTAYDEIGPVALLRVTYGGLPGSFAYEVESSSAES